MGKRRQSPKRLFPDETVKKGRSTPGSPSNGSANETTARYQPATMGSPSPLSFAAESAFAMARAREDCVRRMTLAQELHRPTPGSPSDGSVDEITMRYKPVTMGSPSTLSFAAESAFVMMRARDILAQELHGLAYVDCAVIDVAGGEEVGLIKLIIE